MKPHKTIGLKIVVLSIIIFSSAFTLIKFKQDGLNVVQTTSGLVSGVKNTGGDVLSFKGIPYAAAPIGNLRWKAPQPAKSWQGVRVADKFGASPIQGKPVPFGVYTSEFLIPETPIDEDCLYLNVWTNAKTKQDKRPVLVWIYGGGFSSGGSGVPIYDGEAMAKKDVIFVSINYRVGILGFLAHPDLTKESPNHASGNYGLLDQIAALKWIKQNIQAFGGDPDNVTIAGQSAGSMSVNALVASPLAKGLFAKAISESGSFLLSNSTTLKGAEEQGQKLAEANSLTLKQLREMPAEAVQKLQGRFSVIIDGYVLSQPVSQIFAEGKQNQVPVITGWNADDSFSSAVQKKEDFIKRAQNQYGADAAEFLKHYPANTDAEAGASNVKISRDQTFALSGYKWGAVQSAQAKNPIYLYYFGRKVPATPEFEKYGAFHTAEVPYVLNTLKFLNRPLQPADHELAELMSSYWANFAKTGNPNSEGLPLWPVYKPNDGIVMIFNEHSMAGVLPGKGGLNFLLSRTEKD
ncbi:carboxylesterase family protein [Pseudopedobacter sp.]|uniref:carboxylesterase/lipase family protein n=1 Tax=Pseudopedobacter sp. TaxID=1936787 RepID=UPI00333EC6F2